MVSGDPVEGLFDPKGVVTHRLRTTVLKKNKQTNKQKKKRQKELNLGAGDGTAVKSSGSLFQKAYMTSYSHL